MGPVGISCTFSTRPRISMLGYGVSCDLATNLCSFCLLERRIPYLYAYQQQQERAAIMAASCGVRLTVCVQFSKKHCLLSNSYAHTMQHRTHSPISGSVRETESRLVHKVWPIRGVSVEGTQLPCLPYIAHSDINIVPDASLPSLKSGRILKATTSRSPALTVALCDVAATHQTRQDQR